MKIFAISLGCAKNSIDTELILGALSLMPDAFLINSPENADVILVNTCGFLESAVQESIDTILEMAENKTSMQILAVSGCMVERYGAALEQELTEVDIFHGTRQPEVMAEKIQARFRVVREGATEYGSRVKNQPENSANLQAGQQGCIMAGGRLVTTPPWRAFVKIAEGCSNRCTYCLIPSIRGRNICRPPGELTDEINQLAQSGIREITLLSQDLTSYRYGDMDLAGLVKTVVEQTEIPWLRLLYLHPSGITDELLNVMARYPARICPYLDIPVQHSATEILKRMGRGYDSQHLDRLFARVRAILPDAALRTTVMVGFPGETRAHFNELMEFLEKRRFMHLGSFIYSDEEECAAHRLEGKVAQEIAEERKRQVMQLQAEISGEINRKFLNTTVSVLVEGLSQETDLLLQGRTMFQAPEVDGITYISDGTANPGDICSVKITDSHIYDLVGGRDRVSHTHDPPF